MKGEDLIWVIIAFALGALLMDIKSEIHCGSVQYVPAPKTQAVPVPMELVCAHWQVTGRGGAHCT